MDNTINNNNINVNEFANGLTNIDVTRVVNNVPLGTQLQCHKEENHSPCDHTYKYRNFNGWCNNLNNPQYGKSISPLLRFLPAQYDDAISRQRFRSVGSKPLPSPRLVSIVVHADVSHLHTRYTLMLMQFGQFLDHDLTLTPVNKGVHNIILDCRACDSSQTVHPECWPIPVPRNDPYFPALNISSGRPHCIAFTRSLPGQQRLGMHTRLPSTSSPPPTTKSIFHCCPTLFNPQGRGSSSTKTPPSWTQARSTGRTSATPTSFASFPAAG